MVNGLRGSIKPNRDTWVWVSIKPNRGNWVWFLTQTHRGKRAAAAAALLLRPPWPATGRAGRRRLPRPTPAAPSAAHAGGRKERKRGERKRGERVYQGERDGARGLGVWCCARLGRGLGRRGGAPATGLPGATKAAGGALASLAGNRESERER